MTTKPVDYQAIKNHIATHEDAMVRFLRDMVAIPSESAEERDVIARIRQEMEDVGFDEVIVDGLGNIRGRMGSGAHVLAMDAHVDTVGIGDPGTWEHDPYEGKLEDGVIYGRGAADQEGGMAAMVYGAKAIKDLDLAGDYQLWVTGTVMEEDCDGLCWQYLLREKILTPEVVVITEPTNLHVYRGHRGRMELEVRTQGKSAHGAMPHLGDNAIYKMGPIIADIERLNERLDDTADPFLGKGTCTISDIRSTSPSLCAVADSCTIHVDRRLTVGEDEASSVAELLALPSVKAAEAEVTVLDYARESYTGLVYPTKKYYPTWVVKEDAPITRASMEVAGGVLDDAPILGRWDFSTNGVATCGMFDVPTIGFGPGNEIHAHTTEDQCPVDDLRKAAAFYAAFPKVYLATKA